MECSDDLPSGKTFVEVFTKPQMTENKEIIKNDRKTQKKRQLLVEIQTNQKAQLQSGQNALLRKTKYEAAKDVLGETIGDIDKQQQPKDNQTNFFSH